MELRTIKKKESEDEEEENMFLSLQKSFSSFLNQLTKIIIHLVIDREIHTREDLGRHNMNDITERTHTCLAYVAGSGMST